MEFLNIVYQNSLVVPTIVEFICDTYTEKSKPYWLLPKPQQFRAARTAGESSSVNCLSVNGLGGRSNCYGARPERKSQ